MAEKLMRRTQARSAERERHRARQARQQTLLRAITLAALVLFVGVAAAYVISTQAQPNVVGAVGPRLQVDREKIDAGNRVFDQPVRVVFNVKNVGDGTLKLETPRVAVLLEGC